MKHSCAALRHAAGLIACLLALVGCNPVEELREEFIPSTPREAYEHALRSAGLEGSALVRDWTAAAATALESAATVAAPFQETGYLAPERPGAVGYRLSVRRGQRVSVDARLDADSSALLFVEVFRVPEDTLSGPTHVESADRGSRTLEFEPRRDGDYLIRVQPELLRGGRYSVEIRNGPALAFPVHGGGNRNIQSIYGDPRDGGRRDHRGIDIFVPRGTPALAAAEGVITRVQETPRGGKVVWLSDERRGARLYYAHLDSQLVERGMRVKIGDTLGLVGNTGNARSTPPHLHFGVYQRGAVDPLPWVRQLPVTPPKLVVNTERVGHWTRAARDAVNLRASPDADAALLAELPRHTAMHVLAATGEWYRVQLPDGRFGFVVGRLLEDAEKPLRTEVLAAGRPVRLAPTPTAVAIDSVAAGQSVDVLGRFGDFLYVQAATGRSGWLSID